ncbi:MAG: hypothetical protein LQ337_004351 [Flavoplaca oasis]|nr:MAG: hypothetical protein LQ337_004351 [Flavoplaca oasis]
MTESYNPTKTSLSPRETELLIIALQCLEGGEIKVNYDKFAKMAEYNNRKSACTILGGLIKHKITSSTVDNFSVASGTGNTIASPKKRAAPKAKTSSADTHDDDQDENAAAKPTPKKRGPKKQAGGSPGKRAKKNSEATIKEEDGNEEAEEAAEGEGIKQEGEGEFFEAAIGSAREDLEI